VAAIRRIHPVAEIRRMCVGVSGQASFPDKDSPSVGDWKRCGQAMRLTVADRPGVCWKEWK